MPDTPTRIRTLPLSRLAGMLLLLLVLTGCGSAGEENPGSDVDTAVDSAGGGSSGSPQDSILKGRELKKLSPGAYKQTWILPDESIMNFVICVPTDVALDKPVPLVLALHFGARRYSRFFGQGLVGQLILPGLEDRQALVVAPDVINKSWTNAQCEQSVMALLQELGEVYPIDRERVLVTGFSLGGRGTWHFAGNYPEFFTAAVPIAGRPPGDFAETDWQVPMLCIQSNRDEVFPIAYTREAIEQLQQNDLTIQLYEIDGISHYETRKYVEPLQHAMKWVDQVWDSAGEAENAGN